MQRIIICATGWLVLTTTGSSVLAGSPNVGITKLQGTWVATKVVRNGESADAVIGHRLTFKDRRFVVHSPDGNLVYKGEVQLNANKNPAAINFMHTAGELKGKMWKGIYAMKGNTLRICDNAPDLAKPRPLSFAAKAGSGYVSLVFQRGSTDNDLIKAVKKLNLAFKKRDAAEIKRDMTPDHIAIVPYYAKPQSVTEQIATLNDFKIDDYTMGKVTTIFLNKNVAIVTYTVRYKGTYAGKKMLSPNLASGVWVQRGGRWLEASYQETPLHTK